MSAKKLQLFVFLLVLLELKGQSIEGGCYGSICWEDESYPAEEINEAWKMSGLKGPSSTIYSRSGSFQSLGPSCSLCRTSVGIRVQPLSLIDNGVKYFIVRNKLYKETLIDIKTCAPEENQEDSSCHMQDGRLNESYSCQQRETSMTLLVYDPATKTFLGKSITFNSGCECRVKKG